MRRFFIILSVVALALVTAAPVSAGNNRAGNGNSPIILDHVWVDDEAYDTIILGSLPYNEHNGHSFNTIYPVFLPELDANGDPVPAQGPVAVYAPGDPEYRGGRWVPEPAFWTQEAVDGGLVVLITNIVQLHALEDAGLIVSPGELPQLAFECPLLPDH